MRQPPDERERRPGAAAWDADQMHSFGGEHIVIKVPRQRRSPLVCWRCGVPFALTTAEVLRRCAELARQEAAG